MPRSSDRVWALPAVLLAVASGLAVVPGPTAIAVAQSDVGGEVRDLNRALQRLADNPRNVDALNDAGEASFDVGDSEAAVGFFGRALDLEPQSRRANLGLARTMVLLGRPSEALRFFALAERSGANLSLLAGERGLALDLVGQHALAQQLYRQSLERRDEAEVRRQLAASYAVSGQRENFEATLLPLLQTGDRAAFRTRAFGLAALGDQGEARSLIDALGPPRLAARTYPFLARMVDMSGRQQIAAINLGVFDTSEDDDRPTVATAFADLATPTPRAPATTPPTTSRAVAAPTNSATQDEAPKIWVQVATGRDRSALRFDWRRIVRNSGGLLADRKAYLARWGETNRLLTGPFANLNDANDFVKALKENGIDSFRYTGTGDDGVTPLPPR